MLSRAARDSCCTFETSAKHLPFGQKQNGGCVPPPPRPISLLETFFLFPRMNQDLIGMRLSDVVEVQRELLVAFDRISVEDFRQCFQQWERHKDRCIQSQGHYLEGD